VEGLKVSSPEKGVRLAEELFGEKIQRQKKDVEEKSIISSREVIEITAEGCTLSEPASISIEQEETYFTPDLIEELKERGVIEKIHESKDFFRLKFSLQQRKVQTIIRSSPRLLTETRIVIGRRDLAGFLIDPSKRTPGITKGVIKSDLRAADRILCEMDKSLHLLRELRPLNLEEELMRLHVDTHYNPVFLQRETTLNFDQMEAEIQGIETDTSPLGILLMKKRKELLQKITLLRSRGNAKAFTAASLALYGAPSRTLIGFAKAHLDKRKACQLNREGNLPATKAKEIFERTLQSYGLHEWQILIKADMVSDCAVGGEKIFIRSGAFFTEEHIASLIAHEIETHVLTSENGALQPYKIFKRGFANYTDTQEGLAIYNQIRLLSPDHEKRYLFAKNVLGIAYALDHSFAELRTYLREELGFKKEKAIMKAIDFKRGINRTEEVGAFTRGLAYFRGYRAIEHFVQHGGDLRKLYVGKIAIEDLPLIERIPNIQQGLILPVWLRPTLDAKKTKKTNKKK
jgi:uncharacterized protein (TIGR02421 family)